MRLEIGNRVRCTDGVYGELADIVIDPLEKRVAHLVVRPDRAKADARLVPIQLAKGRDDEQREIELGCTLDEAEEFESVHKAAYLRLGDNPTEDPDWDVGVEDVFAMPYYAGGLDEDAYGAQFDSRAPIYYDRVPKGEVEVRRSSVVFSADDHLLGEVDGFVVDADQHITHFVLERAGLNAKTISTYLGHSSISLTLNRYGHLFDGNEQEAAGLLDTYIATATAAAAGAHPG